MKIISKTEDALFDSLLPSVNGYSPEKIKPINTPNIPEVEAPSLASYGNNRKLVAQIISDNGKAMRKTEIIEELLRREPKVQFAESVVRNSLSALKARKVVRQFKPPEVRLKGGYWTLEKWWTGNKLKEECQPAPYDPSVRYVND